MNNQFLNLIGGEIEVKPENFHLLNTQKNKINIINQRLEEIKKNLIDNNYIKYFEGIENNNSDIIKFIKNYNNITIIFCDLVEINSELKKINKLTSNNLENKDTESNKVIKSLNEVNDSIKKDTEQLNNMFNYLFNKLNVILAEKIENGSLDIEELFSNIIKLNNNKVETLIKENNSGNNRLTPYSFVIEDNEKLFELTNHLKNEQNIKKEYSEYLQVDKIINPSELDLTFNEDLPEKHKELLSITLKKNFKFLFNKILGNPNLSDEEKIDEIEKIFRENIENNYLFVFREKAGEIFEEIFKHNYLGKDIFERLISKENKNGVNKNIRLKFIENYENLDEILEYLFNPFNKKEKDRNNEIEEEIKIKLGTRSTIEVLKRLKKERDITKDINKKKKYNDYYTYFKKVLIEKYNKNKHELNSDNTYNEEKNKNNIKLIEEYFKTTNISELKEEVFNDFNKILENKQSIDLQEEINNNTVEDIKSTDLVKMIKKGTYSYILYNMFENGKIKKGRKQWKKQIALAILENSKTFTINTLLNNDFFSEQDKEKIILEFISKGDNLVKKLEVLNIINFSFNKKEILKTLISGNVFYQDFINILGNKYFKDIKLELYNEDGTINSEGTEIFLNIFFKSENEELAIQGIGMMKSFTKQLVEEGIYISPNKKEYTLSKDQKVIFELNNLS